MFYKIVKYPFFGRFTVKWKNPLSEDERKEWRKISIKSKSGGLIHGLFAQSKTNEEKATVVLGHPMGKEAKGYFLKRGYTDLLRNNGFNVVIFDINGFGESTQGSFSYFEDIIAIGIKAKQLTPELPIAYHGISLGAMWATISFADESHVYDFAIIESAATSLPEFWVHFPVAYRVLQVFNMVLPNYRKKIDMIERMKEVKHLQSLFFIYCERDPWVALDMGKRFEQNSPVPAELWTVKKAKHAEIMLSPSKDTYKEKIINYLNQEVSKMNTSKSE